MSDVSAKLSMPYLQPAQAQKHVTHNDALRLLDIAVQLAVTDRDQSAPPASPAMGDSHIVGAGASGDWLGMDGLIATWDLGGWLFTTPRAGWRARVLTEALTVVFDGTGWAADTPAMENLDGVGIGTTSDSVNVLSVSGEATLLTHDGAGHQIKINKAAPGDTGSLLFQTDWSGRAEMGTTGSDAFAIKVSADGSTWAESLLSDPATGRVSLPQGAEIAAMDETGSDLDSASDGLSRFDGTTVNTPGSSGAAGTVWTASDGVGGVTQSAHLTAPAGDVNKTFVRAKASGTWSAWREV